MPIKTVPMVKCITDCDSDSSGTKTPAEISIMTFFKKFDVLLKEVTSEWHWVSERHFKEKSITDEDLKQIQVSKYQRYAHKIEISFSTITTKIY